MLCWDAIQRDLQTIVRLRERSATPWREIEESTGAFPYASVLRGDPLGQRIVIEWEKLLKDVVERGGADAARLWLKAIRDRSLPSSADRGEGRQMWVGGLERRHNVNPGAFPQLLSITRRAIEHFQPHDEASASAVKVLEDLLPAPLFAKMAREEDGAPELTPPQTLAVPLLPSLLESSRAMLIGCPPGVGKTRLAQIAATAACLTCDGELTGRKALVLLPTRTLVEEQRRSWESWVATSEEEDPLLRVVAASADHPQHDRALASGRFEMAVCVYESLTRQISAPLARQRLLDDCALVVVDEWQWIRDRQRGVWLDSMLSLIAQTQPRPALLLLGPRADETTCSEVKRWFGGCTVLTPSERLTDLEVRIAEHRRSGKAKKNHMWPYVSALHPASPSAKRGESTDATSGTLDLTDTYQHVRAELGPDLTPLVSAQMVEALLVAANELGNDDNARIIIFSETKRMADFHDPVRKVLNALGVGVKPRAQVLNVEARNPWDGKPGAARWPMSTPADPAKRFRELMRRVPDQAERRQAASWLANGVGFHSRGFSRELQQLVVEEFSAGLLRLVFATDTIAQGVNLPATHVVIGRPERVADRGVPEPLDSELVHQRWNRAGRFGHHKLAQAAQGWLWNVVGRGGGQRDSLQALWDRYMSDPLGKSRIRVALTRLEGEEQVEQLALLVLQFLGQQDHLENGMSREEIRLLAREALQATLYYQQVAREGARGGPNLDAVIEHLRKMGALEPDAGSLEDTLIDRLTTEAAVVERDKRYRVSKLGYGLMGSGMRLADSRAIRDVAEVADRLLEEGPESPMSTLRAGLMDLLWTALSAPSVQRAIFQALGRAPDWNEDVGGAWHRRVQAHGQAYTAADVRSRAASFTSLGVKHVPAPHLLEAPRASGDFVTGLEALPADKLAQQLTVEELALLARVQATICAYEWGRYEPFLRIRSRLASCIADAETMAALDPVALQELARHAGYLLRAAAPLTVGRPEMERVAAEVQNGLPRAIMNVVQLSGLGLGREQIAQNLSGPFLSETVTRIATEVGWTDDDWEQYRRVLRVISDSRRTLSGTDRSSRLEWNGDGDAMRADQLLEILEEAEDGEALASQIEALAGPSYLNLSATVTCDGNLVTLLDDKGHQTQVRCLVSTAPAVAPDAGAGDSILLTTKPLPDEQLLSPDPSVVMAAEFVAASRRVLASADSNPSVDTLVGPLCGDVGRAALSEAPEP
jgi:DEAD/DEAH box helicase/Helicase conserved C-terminal domain